MVLSDKDRSNIYNYVMKLFYDEIAEAGVKDIEVYDRLAAGFQPQECEIKELPLGLQLKSGYSKKEVCAELLKALNSVYDDFNRYNTMPLNRATDELPRSRSTLLETTRANICKTAPMDRNEESVKHMLDDLGIAFRNDEPLESLNNKIQDWCALFMYLDNNPKLLQYNIDLFHNALIDSYSLPITQEEAANILRNKPLGSYVIRSSKEGLYQNLPAMYSTSASETYPTPVATITYVAPKGLNNIRFTIRDTGRAPLANFNSTELIIDPILPTMVDIRNKLNSFPVQNAAEAIEEFLNHIFEVYGVNPTIADYTKDWFKL